MSSRAARIARKLGVLAASTLFAALALEVGLATLWPQPTLQRLRAQALGAFAPSDILPYRLRPGSTGRLASGEFDTTITVNAHGFRGPEFPLEKGGVRRVLVVGDSFTFGYGVEDGETYPARMQVRLDEALGEGRVQVVNAGFAACYYPDTYYLWLKEVGLGLEPDLVLVGFFLGNDVDHGEVYENVWTEIDEQGLPLRIVNQKHELVKGRRVPREKPLRYRLPLVRESHAAQAVATLLGGPPRVSGAEPPPPRTADQPDLLIEDVERRGRPKSEHFNHMMYRPVYAERTQAAVRKVQRLLAAMQELTQAADVPLLVVMIPAREQVRPEDFALDRVLRTYDLEKPQRIFAAFFEERGIPYLDLLPALRADDSGKLLYYVVDSHWTRAGNALAGRLIADHLLASGLLE